LREESIIYSCGIYQLITNANAWVRSGFIWGPKLPKKFNEKYMIVLLSHLIHIVTEIQTVKEKKRNK
jgi:hypothetical protein